MKDINEKTYNIVRRANAAYTTFCSWLDENTHTDEEAKRASLLKDLAQRKLYIIEQYYNDIQQLLKK